MTEDDALQPYRDRSADIQARIEEMEQGRDAEPIGEDIDQMATGLDLLTEVVSGLKIDDATARTRILEEISGVFALVNRARAALAGKRKSLFEKEGVAEFGAQFKLLTQSVQSALGLCDTPEKCDEQLTRLMVSLEELEGKFGEFDQFLGDLAQKRDEIYETFTGRKQQLLEERQRRAQNLANAADRILQGVSRRANTFKEVSDLNAYFASDAMVMKVRDIAQDLLEVGDTVRADEIQSRIKKAREDAIRQLRDKSELFDEEGGDQVVKFGQHRFTVNTQSLDLTLLPRDEGLALHLTGTDYFEQVTASEEWGPKLLALRDFWNRSLVSESKETYRGEYLAASILFAAESNTDGLSLERLHQELLREVAIGDDQESPLLHLVREIAGERYDEGYDRGVHDHDAALILEKVLHLYSTAGLLRFSPRARSLACLFWGVTSEDDDKTAMRESWMRRARSFGRLRTSFGHTPALGAFAQEVAEAVALFNVEHALEMNSEDVHEAGVYLAEELMNDPVRFTTSAEATRLVELFFEELDGLGSRPDFEADVRELSGDLKSQAAVARAWVETFLDRAESGAGSAPDIVAELRPVASEAVVHILVGTKVSRDVTAALSAIEITGLLGNHARIKDGSMTVRLDAFLDRMRRFIAEDVERFRAFRELRHELLEGAKEQMRLEEFKPRVLSSFVRNKLINDVYLPLVGDNLAKQIGGVGKKKRTDLMGLLLLISPPGYGKTTLMEYIASRLGLVFMKVNGPSLGHDVHSLDPAEAPNATARQEVEKINLAFEMGNNVMLYLDDIQHTHPELLQKFISLCDGSRRIEGVWQGKTRTYDLRGKKFCVVMAGNPYTESGDKFQIPDMLSNRADTYNLGDILGGREDAFALSYVENALTSNPVLQPLATREQKDVYQLVRMANGEDLPLTDLSHGYSGVEVDEVLSVLKKMLACQEVLLKVNAEYIRSASMDDRYRTEPRFQLQGSYRNMNKLAEKIVAVMNEEELERVISDHYQQEAQTLTTGAEQNLLKLKELRGTLTEEERERWEDVKKTFARNQMSGGDDDPITKVTNTLAGLSQHLEGIRDVVEDRGESAVSEHAQLQKALGNLTALSDLANLVREVGGVKTSLAESPLAATLESTLRETLNPIAPALGALEVGSERTTRAVLKAGQVIAESDAKTRAEDLESRQRQADQLAELLGNMPVNIQVDVPTDAFTATLSQQQKLVEGSLLPVLEAALGAQAAANAANAATQEGATRTVEAATKAAEKAAAAAQATARSATNGTSESVAKVDSGAVPEQVAESLVLLRELFERMEKGQVGVSGTYRPFKPKPMGTRADDE